MKKINTKTVTISGNKVAQDDLKFFKPSGDDGFSPERNKQVIADSIKKYEAMRRKKIQEYKAQLDERSDAVASYFSHLNQTKFTPVENYFGKSNLAHLRGQKILARVINAQTGLTKLEEIN